MYWIFYENYSQAILLLPTFVSSALTLKAHRERYPRLLDNLIPLLPVMPSFRPLGSLFIRTRFLLLLILAIYAFICYFVYTSLPSSSISEISDQPHGLVRHDVAGHEDPHLAGDKANFRRKIDVSRQLDELRARLNLSLHEMLDLRQRIEVEKDNLARERARLLNKPEPPAKPQQPIEAPSNRDKSQKQKPVTVVQTHRDQQVYPQASTLQVFGEDETKRDTVKKVYSLFYYLMFIISLVASCTIHTLHTDASSIIFLKYCD